MAGPVTERLDQLDVLAVDCQSTGASPIHGSLLEVGWARAPRLSDAKQTTSGLDVVSELVKLPDGHTIPRPVARLTGIDADAMTSAVMPALVWEGLVAAAREGSGVAVIHYARFEEAFLRHLHQEQAPQEPFPLEIICTHEIARRLWPDLPRRGLRALAGYLGYGVDELKRSAEHVRATLFVWQHLVAHLRDEYEIKTYGELVQWLAIPPPRASRRRAYPMPRQIRLALPDEPGVYRMLRASGEVLYVGKATSLRKRVNSYFRKHSKVPERTLEMLTQARDLRVTPTATVLEAALLESDEIKAYEPAYNVALRRVRRAVWYATSDFSAVHEQPGRRYRLGPLGSRLCPVSPQGPSRRR